MTGRRAMPPPAGLTTIGGDNGAGHRRRTRHLIAGAALLCQIALYTPCACAGETPMATTSTAVRCPALPLAFTTPSGSASTPPPPSRGGKKRNAVGKTRKLAAGGTARAAVSPANDDEKKTPRSNGGIGGETKFDGDRLNGAYEALLSELKSLPWTNRQDVKVTPRIYEDDDGVELALRSALESSPPLVSALEEGGEGLVTRLLDRVGTLSRSVMVEMISRHPDLMARVLISDSIRTKEAQLKSDLELTSAELRKITRTIGNDQFKRLNRSKIRELIYYFRNDVALTDEQLRRMILLRPQLLLYSVTNLSAKVRFFREELDMSQEEFVRMIRTVPLVLAYSVENRLRPTVEFLKEEIGSTKWKWIAYRYPQIFSYSLENTLRPKCKFFMENLHLMGRSDISQIASKFPPTLWLPEHTILSKADFLMEELDLSNTELRDVLVTFPQVLGLSLDENLRPTVDFLLEGAGLSRVQLKDFVLYQPALLAYSLEKRIRPRITRMQELGVSFSFAPPNIMCKTDEKFNEWLQQQSTTWSITD